MQPIVIVHNKIPEDILEQIKETCQVHYFPEGLNRSNLPEVLNEAEGVLGSGVRVDKEFLDKAPNLKIVSNISVGFNNLDIEELTKRKIMATNTPDVLTDTTADTIFGLLLATARRMAELDRYVKEGRWNQSVDEALFGVDVHHKTLGIIGMGRIGAAIAKRGRRGFDMDILYHNRSRNEQAEKEYGAVYCSLDDLLKKSDFVCLMTPLTSETKRLIGLDQFKLMKETAIFINGSRGLTVNEDDLVYALKNKLIYAAGLDVFEKEPISKDHPFLEMPNVMTLPHIGSATHETRYEMEKIATKNFLEGLQGKRPPSLLNPGALSKKEEVNG
ncbi:2-hydroxyacid dehydrogenase [Pseudalkalibacillus sp. A8]|uniref:2-hydroxyacid dehydrogenase n=1 Tax=Pseudalkalibacillus sp. A8 TaxID=3382641 RepID=UPI0038B60459